ncbi:peroxiredoxin [Prevotella sp. 10(H)]|uniref:peroxiredoxin family protein n=1 Tax=Prevotella sp. 10(H) TaxID=1158294 RepID=UPI0004A77155|nr:TlpA disulfide reductase family protein [Prevotella sp. 10(H)]
MKKRFLFFLLYIAPLLLNAQKISISLPQEANKGYSFILSKGIEQDTIQTGIVSTTGDILINIPEKDKDYAGMGSLQIDGSKPFNLIINHENFTVKQKEDQKYIFQDSKENEYLYSIIQDGKQPEKDNTLYASRFIDMIRYLGQLNRATTSGANLMEKANLRLYALNDLDLEELYTSSVWYNVIDGLTKLTQDQQLLGDDMVRLLKRIKSQEVFEHLADNLIVITEQYGWDDAFDIIVPYVEESGRIAVPTGRIFDAFALAKVRKGTVAPQIVGLKPSLKDSKANRILLVFYQPDCPNCHEQLGQLIRKYADLKEQNVRIVSISSDSNKKTFTEEAKRFPWPDSDKLCDYKGFAGPNFLNYGIMSTPTFFLLNEKGIVIKRYALISDIDFSSNIDEEK